jgi:carboxyl-terminal processing protease
MAAMGIGARGLLAAVALNALAACGGGGSSGDGGTGGLPSGSSGNGSGNTYAQGVFPASTSLAGQCAAPRAGTSDRTGSAFTENMFLRSWTNEYYLWYREVQDRNPTGFSTGDYFDLLKTTATTLSGRDKDQFHFTYPTDVWEDLSQSGIEVGYGAQWMIVDRTPPRKVVIAFVEPGTPAASASANLSRGAEVLMVDGVDVVNANTQAAVDTINAGLFPDTAGTPHTFRIREASGDRDVTMTTAAITHDPVPTVSVIDPTGVPVGYLLFNDHIATAESALIEAVNTLRAANIQDLILDLRYNGGGYLDIASELAYMIAGSVPTAGQPFERLVFNDKYPNTNPITNTSLTPTPFHTSTRGIDSSVARGTALPTLNLNRVYVITGANTCSASESIINGLRGVGVQVYQIGSTTCGKPYGFYPKENCGTTYFSIQFQGLNAQGFGDYADGFTPQNSTSNGTVRVSGCAIADDLSRELGDATEARLQAALSFRASNNQTCPAATSVAPGGQLKPGQAGAADGILFRSPLRENRILREEPFGAPASVTRVRMINTRESWE